MIDKKWLTEKAVLYGVQMTPEKAAEIDRYCEAVAETNRSFNLTAITDPDGMQEKNALDCLTVLPFLPDSGSIADVGTGAGFPGAMIRIMRPDLKLTLIEATDKKLQFVLKTLRSMGLDTEGVHLRGEDAGRGEYREQFDAVTARAVAPLPSLMEYTLPLVKNGGKLIAMKGADGKEELEEARNAIKILGGSITGIHELDLPTAGKRVILEIRKEKACPMKYPRQSRLIRKNPL